MSDIPALALAWLAGGALGVIFFGGLRWTVRKGLSSKQPAAWFFVSLLLRMGIVLSGFYFVGRGNWKRLLLSLLGFVTARLVVTRLTRPSAQSQTHPDSEASHAP